MRTTALGLTCAMMTAAVALTGCGTGPLDGGSLARDIAEQEAARLNDKFGHRDRVRDAEYIAATEVPKGAQTDGETHITPVGWSGRTTGDEKATIDVRFAVTVPERHAATLGDRGNSAGSATRCYRYVLQLYRYTEYHKIGCPAIATPPVPSASPVLTLPGDATDRLAAALRTATPDTLSGAVRAAFPQDGISVDTVTHEGILVAAVGVPAERDCILMIRTADGATKQLGYDPVQLEPGELGCSVGLYTNPPR
ncbi:hypothetical protein [Dactylosporangium sp. NPDC048998]|uniref:hypothetical protein n=1 Tax=Dactylosporangium sp. NPDC048998 TaxID=3363976 RepID=UPI0037108454